MTRTLTAAERMNAVAYLHARVAAINALLTAPNPFHPEWRYQPITLTDTQIDEYLDRIETGRQ